MYWGLFLSFYYYYYYYYYYYQYVIMFVRCLYVKLKKEIHNKMKIY